MPRRAPSPPFCLSPVREIAFDGRIQSVRVLVCPSSFCPADPATEEDVAVAEDWIAFPLDASGRLIVAEPTTVSPKKVGRRIPHDVADLLSADGPAPMRAFVDPFKRTMEDLLSAGSDRRQPPEPSAQEDGLATLYLDFVRMFAAWDTGIDGSTRYFMSTRFSEELHGMSAHLRATRLRAGWRFSDTWTALAASLSAPERQK